MYAKKALNYGENSLGKKIHPNLLYASIQPFGQEVPQPQDADKKLIHACPVLILLLPKYLLLTFVGDRLKGQTDLGYDSTEVVAMSLRHKASSGVTRDIKRSCEVFCKYRNSEAENKGRDCFNAQGKE